VNYNQSQRDQCHSFWCNSPQGARVSSFTRFLDHTERRTSVDRTPLDEWSARRMDLYPTTQNTHNRQISMPPMGFEPTISACERPQTYALDSASTGTGNHRHLVPQNIRYVSPHHFHHHPRGILTVTRNPDHHVQRYETVSNTVIAFLPQTGLPHTARQSRLRNSFPKRRTQFSGETFPLYSIINVIYIYVYRLYSLTQPSLCNYN
jgi:hypothetical protein